MDVEFQVDPTGAETQLLRTQAVKRVFHKWLDSYFMASKIITCTKREIQRFCKVESAKIVFGR